jgi:isoaspartyl peptidase/L-asparaginase-like protein (Ntn-hydrolase superfamily)
MLKKANAAIIIHGGAGSFREGEKAIERLEKKSRRIEGNYSRRLEAVERRSFFS